MQGLLLLLSLVPLPCPRRSHPRSCIAVVQRHLASLGGPRRDVPPPVWAELMRTPPRKQTWCAQASDLVLDVHM